MTSTNPILLPPQRYLQAYKGAVEVNSKEWVLVLGWLLLRCFALRRDARLGGGLYIGEHGWEELQRARDEGSCGRRQLELEACGVTVGLSVIGTTVECIGFFC
jgi:hypothetical protein